MAIVLTEDGFVVLDESSGLQNTGIAETNEDNDDHDIALASLNADFFNRLFGVGELNLDSAFAGANGVAENDFISLTEGSTLSGFVDGSGDPLLAYVVGVTDPTTGIEVSFTTLDGEKIYLFADVADGLGDFMVLGVDENGDIIFAGHLDADGTISLVQMEAISNPDGIDHDDPVDLSGLLGVAATSSLDFDFDELPSGSNLFGVVGESATEPAIIVFGRDVDLKADGTYTNTSDVIHTSQGGTGATIGVNNQMFDPGDGAFFVYVNDPVADFLSGVPGGLTQTEADDADNVQYTGGTLDVSSAFLTISQIQGNKLATLDLTAYLGDPDQARDLVQDPESGTDPVEIILVRVTVGTDVYEFDADADPPQAGIDVSGFGTDTVTVSGLSSGYTVEWVTDGLHNRVLVEGVEGKFDVGRFGISEATTTFEPVGDRMIFEDDGPAIVGSGDPTPQLVTDDTDIPDSAGPVSFAGLFTPDFGTDGAKDADNDGIADADAVTYALGVSAADADSGLVDTLTGEAVVLNLVGTDVVGTTELGGLEVLRISVDANTGDVSLSQSRAVVHDDPDDPIETGISAAALASADLVTLTATATDDDGDADDTTVDIGDAFKFEDDGPSIGPIDDGVVDFVAGDSVTKLLGADTGSDGASATITDFTESFDFGFGTVIGVLSNDEKSVTYYEDEDGSGVIEAGETNAFFTLAIDDSDADAANWDYTFAVLQDPEPVSLEFNFDELPSGSNLFGVVGESATEPAIIVVGRDPDLDTDGKYTNISDVIHTSQGGTGATIGVNNQMFDPGDGAYFSYVDDPVADFLSGVPGGLTQTEADDGDNIQYGDTLDVSSAFLVISQVQGNSLVAMDITTFLQPAATQGTDFIDSLGLAGDPTPPNITAVRVYDQFGSLIEDTSDLVNFDDATVDVTGLNSATVRVSGLDDGYKIEWVTDSLHNQVLVEGVAGKFDVGAFGISQPQPTPDAELDFEVTIEDFDGDTEVADFTIGVDGDLDGFITV